MMKINKRNSLFSVLFRRPMCASFTYIATLVCSSLSFAEKPPLTDPAFESPEQLKILHRDVRKPINEQLRLQTAKAKAKDRHAKIENLHENGADTHTVENRLIERQQLKTAALGNEIASRQLGSERVSPLWAGNHQDIFSAENRNNYLQFNQFTGSMEPANVRGEVGVTIKIGDRALQKTNFQLR